MSAKITCVTPARKFLASGKAFGQLLSILSKCSSRNNVLRTQTNNLHKWVARHAPNQMGLVLVAFLYVLKIQFQEVFSLTEGNIGTQCVLSQ